MVKIAFADDQARYVMVLIHTGGAQDLATDPRQDLDDCLAKYNDTADPDASELLTARILKQVDVHGLVARGTQGDPIDIEVALFEWGEAKDPFAVYGQVAASGVATWWKRYYPQIVSQNIRMFLGTDTEVNAGLQNTLISDPGHFWHFNNGITVVCREIKAKMLGGRSKDSGYFNCYDVRIVNGAQTAGSIAAALTGSPKPSIRPASTSDSSPWATRLPTRLRIPSQKPPTLKTGSTDRTSLPSIPNSNGCEPN